MGGIDMPIAYGSPIGKPGIPIGGAPIIPIGVAIGGIGGIGGMGGIGAIGGIEGMGAAGWRDERVRSR